MKNLEYDVITQSIKIPNDVIQQSYASRNELALKNYIKSELVRGLAEKLIKCGYTTETWIKHEYSEECILTLYVKPLANNN